MRKSTKLAVVFAAAMLLVVGFAMTAIAGTAHWDSSTGQWQYINADGDVVTNDKIKWQGKYYFVDEDGNLVTNKLWEFDGARYYTDANGNLVTGWVKVPADEADEELEVTYRWYYFQSSGKAFTANNYATGVQYKTIDGKRYKFDTDGKMLFGFINGNDMITSGNAADQADAYYGTNETGAAVTDWVQYTDEDSDKTYWYYFKKGAKVESKSEKINNKYYAFDDQGRMQSGWQPDAATANTYFNANGDQVKKAWVYAVPKADESKDDPSKKWFYFGSNGETYKSQVAKINGKFYAFDDNAQMLAGLVWVNNAAIVGEEAKTANTIVNANKDSIAAYKAEAAGKTGFTLYYFSGDYANDGSRKVSATVEVTFNDDATATFVFDKTGKALHGLNNKKIYVYGMLQKAGDAKYALVENVKATSTEQKWYVVNSNGAIVTSTGKADDDTVFAVRKYDSADSKAYIAHFRDFDGVNTVAGAFSRQSDFKFNNVDYTWTGTADKTDAWATFIDDTTTKKYCIESK